jgi:hypothetical protein
MSDVYVHVKQLIIFTIHLQSVGFTAASDNISSMCIGIWHA